jgi:hypothetical protein
MALPSTLYTGHLTETATVPAGIGHSFWLVRTPAGGAEVQDWGPGSQLGGPSGSKPVAASVYLGNTVADVNQWISTAAGRLGVPNPQNIPSLGTTLGIVGAEVGGFGLGAAAAASTAAEAAAAEATAVGAEATAATETGTAGAAATGGAATAAKTAASKFAGKAATSGFLTGLGALAGWQGILVRALGALVGIALLFLGLQALTGTGDGNPVTAAKNVAKVVK